jgi:hypothetical protein
MAWVVHQTIHANFTNDPKAATAASGDEPTADGCRRNRCDPEPNF